MARVLVVEDIPITRKVIELALGRMGHEVVGTCSPLMAAELVRGQMPDLLVLDYFMPALDGIALLDDLRAEFGDRCPKALFVSAAPCEVIMAGAERFAGLEYVGKPFRLRDLECAVARALRTDDAGAAHGEGGR